MKRLLFLFAILWPMLLTGQTIAGRQFAGKINLTGVLTRRLGLAFELLRGDRNKNLEFQASYQWQNAPPIDLFNGDWNIHYAKSRSDMIIQTGLNPIEISPWTYLGNGRPLSEIQPVNRVSILQFQLGMRMSPEAPYQDKKWRLFAQPGLSVSRHRFFELRQLTVFDRETRDTWHTQTASLDIIQIRTTHYYHQHNAMRLRDKWLAGVTFDLGVGRTLGRAFFLEGRLTGGFDLDSPYQANGTAPAHKGLYGRAALYAGYFFGMKTRSAKTPDI